MTGIISSIEPEYAVIHLDDGKEERVDLESWILRHGKPSVGDKVVKLYEVKENTFGTHFYGFAPFGFTEQGYAESLPS